MEIRSGTLVRLVDTVGVTARGMVVSVIVDTVGKCRLADIGRAACADREPDRYGANHHEKYDDSATPQHGRQRRLIKRFLELKSQEIQPVGIHPHHDGHSTQGAAGADGAELL